MAKYNVNSIMDKLRNKTTNVKTFKVFDGITIQCVMNEQTTEEQLKTEMKNIQSICKTLKLPSSVTDKNKFCDYIFLLQFPDLEPTYTDEELERMYKTNLIWMLDTSFHNDINNIMSVNTFKNNVEMLVTDLLRQHYESCVNKYKHTLKEIIQDKEQREKITKWVNEVLSNYTYTGERVIIKDDKV